MRRPEMIVTEKLKDSMRKWFSARAAAGEGSLKTWGGMQRPPITGSQAEDVADALVEDGLLSKEERASGWVWRKVLATAGPAALPAERDEEQDEEEEQDEDEAPASAPASSCPPATAAGRLPRGAARLRA